MWCMRFLLSHVERRQAPMQAFSAFDSRSLSESEFKSHGQMRPAPSVTTPREEWHVMYRLHTVSIFWPPWRTVNLARSKLEPCGRQQGAKRANNERGF